MAGAPVFSQSVLDVFRDLETNQKGLGHEEALARKSLYGDNKLVKHDDQANLLSVISYFLHPQSYILFFAAFIAVISKDYILSIVIVTLIIANAFFSFWRQYRAEKAVEKLQEILPTYSHVLRDGKNNLVASVDVVPGDILILEEGDNISADARVIEEYGLRTNNSTLTGESIPSKKTSDPSFQDDISELEQPNLIFAGTSVASGTGRAVVYATGMLTQFGRIAHLTQTIDDDLSPFQLELRKITRNITYISLAIGVIVFFIGFTTDIGLTTNKLILFTLGIIVAMIPEGLPATLTLSLAAAVQRLATKGVLVKKLNTVEKLGSVSVICTDKSGTLTQNQMTVRQIWVSGQQLTVEGVGYEPIGKIIPDPSTLSSPKTFELLLTAGYCCNNSRLNPPSIEHINWTCLGDQTEAALKVVALKANTVEERMQYEYPRIYELPFDARRKRMSTVHRKNSQLISFTKGAPKEVLQLCTKIMINDEVVDLDNVTRSEIMKSNDTYAKNTLRVLAVAFKEHDKKTGPFTADLIETDMIFLGLMAMMDPPRPEVEAAVAICRNASIRIIMITGDYGLTALSLAKRVGILTTRNPRIMTGSELDQLPDSEIELILNDEVLFSRMAPEHKMRLVAILQTKGEVVAVTGDGVNDAPALRKADVGIAMGIVGTDVSKEAADIILTNDNFAAIVSAIEEGRGIYDNVRKFISYIFSSNVPEIMPFIVTSSFTTIPLALKIRQILAIDLGTDLFPAIGLGMEKPEPGIMNNPPRKKNLPLITNDLLLRSFAWLGMIETTLSFLAFFSVYYFSGNWSLLGLPFTPNIPFGMFKMNIPEIEVHLMAVTVFHAGVVFTQVGNAFACRTEKLRISQLGWFTNRYLLFGIFFEILSIFIMINIPFVAQQFEHVRLPSQYWVLLFTFPFILYSLEWFRKFIVRLITIKPKLN